MIELTTAEEIMRRDLVTVSPETTALSAISRMLDANISGAPVVGGDGEYHGVFSEKCSLNALKKMVDVAVDYQVRMPVARDFMAKRLIKLTPDWEVFRAIDHILNQKISGVPVVDQANKFLGVFSEKTAMRVLMAAIHDSVPGTCIEAFLNLDRNRIIHADTSLAAVANKFQETPYRRLPVLKNGQLVGQISRRDALRAELKVSSILTGRLKSEPDTVGLSEELKNQAVQDFQDREALTINPRTDLFTIAQMFLNSTYRRLPVLDDQKRLVGQISRRDLLMAASNMMKPDQEKKKPKPFT